MNPHSTRIVLVLCTSVGIAEDASGKCVTLKVSNTSLSSVDEDALKDIDICQVSF